MTHNHKYAAKTIGFVDTVFIQILPLSSHLRAFLGTALQNDRLTDQIHVNLIRIPITMSYYCNIVG